MIKEAIIFSEQGDPRLIKTWSNVPFFLVKTLESKGITVHTVDLSVQDVFQKSLRKLYNFLFSVILKSSFWDYSRSSFYFFFTNFKIKKAIKKYANADVLIFTTFSLSATKFSLKPSILFCDWTIEHYLKYFLNKQPGYLERLAMKRQNKVIENARAVFVLFPSVAKTMKRRFSNPNIFYIGNVVNNLFPSSPDVIKNKSKGNDLLFVGSTKYLQGATDLINAYKLLKNKFSGLKLHIVGITQRDLSVSDDGVYFYGYLDKGNEEQALQYYELLKTASIFINTTPKWASFSASLEAMYFYTPLIITWYEEFAETFGNKIDFGYYYDSKKDQLAGLIDKILTNENYDQLCTAAHTAVKGHSWENYVDRLIDITDSITDKNKNDKVLGEELTNAN